MNYVWPHGLLAPPIPWPKPGAIQVWSVPLEAPADQIAQCRAWLSPDEVARADRFRLDFLSRRFTVGRGALRQILGGYLGVEPNRLAFDYAARGKPSLAVPWQSSGLWFNVSNSHELALVAVSVDGELGVDVEYVRPMRDFFGLAERFFAAAEVAAIRALPEDQQLPAFFRCWTRKEAILKAVGCGIAYPLDKVIVSIEPENPRVLLMHDRREEAADWRLQSLSPLDGYVAALASQRGPGEHGFGEHYHAP